MPICFGGNSSRYQLLPGTQGIPRRSPGGFQERSSKCLTIGLINNMPDGALEATERQFVRLLGSAADHILVRLTLYALPEVPRGDSVRSHVNRFYAGVDGLWNSHLDGLIVTGREPRTPNLMDEPYWNTLTRTLEWANDNTHSTVWSCLAAHGAILHTDGIRRRRSDTKHCGIFTCERVADHHLTTSMSFPLKMPHSRWNGLLEEELSECGYTVLTRSRGAGVDSFVKQRRSLFVYFQGHPEYEADTLLLEYRRDIRRYLSGETETYPSMPQSYFDRHVAERLAVLREKATAKHCGALLSEIETALGQKSISNTWDSAAKKIYSNWLEYLCAQKEHRLRTIKIATRATHEAIYGMPRVPKGLLSGTT